MSSLLISHSSKEENRGPSLAIDESGQLFVVEDPTVPVPGATVFPVVEPHRYLSLRDAV
jgi:hypothetical protein